MNTFSHGIWVYFFVRRRRLAKPAVLGAIFPDLLYSIPLIFYTAKTQIWRIDFLRKFLLVPFKGWDGAFSEIEIKQIHNTLTRLFVLPPVHYTRLITHSYIIWGIVMLFAWYLGKKWLIAFNWGWLTHIFIDMLTHVDDAIPYFYPVWNRIIRGVVSYWNPEYYGTYFATANYLIIMVMILVMIREWWGRRKRGMDMRD
ncbi:hypothetical protein BBF96_06850 [Anoxybacter fermentans]|uniref:Phospholipase C/D domain-containing protein n=1 Tax=Anoxybacter fermentans TaxID=1323375 RepID=A0A3S9SXS1_9FIRM|nr:zinc dependent phospholipase C family protein [Anoxybacter fermentans]AZR73127.1 hypothetical protein BBF96_06850 [Anoxybacter fermentans]